MRFFVVVVVCFHCHCCFDPSTAMDGSTVTRRRSSFWCSEKESELIRLYEMHSLLWDGRHPEYYKRDKRDAAMRSIARTLGPEFDVTSVKDKIKTLRDYFVKELKKEEISRKSSAPGYVSRWEHFGSWRFLRSVLATDAAKFTSPYGGTFTGHVKQELSDTYQIYTSEPDETMILPTIEPPDTPPRAPCTSGGSQSRVCTADFLTRPAAQRYCTPATMTGTDPPEALSAPHGASLQPLLPKWPWSSVLQPGGIDSAAASMDTCATGIHLPGTPNLVSTGVQEVPSAQNAETQDEDTFFCKHVISELRQMPKYQKDLAKLRIQQALFEVKYLSFSAVTVPVSAVSVTPARDQSTSPTDAVGYSSRSSSSCITDNGST